MSGKTQEQLRDEAISRGELPSDDDLRAVAAGRKPRPWRQAVSHPVHGELVFEMELPNALALSRHTIEMDNLLAGLYGEPRGSTMMLVSAIAGLKTLVKLPVVAQHREESEDPDDPRERVTEVRYDPESETNEVWLVDVWSAASAWRAAFVQPGALERLGKSSEATPGSASDTASDAPTASPSTIPA